MTQAQTDRYNHLCSLREGVRWEYHDTFSRLPNSIHRRYMQSHREGEKNFWEQEALTVAITSDTNISTPDVALCRDLSLALQALTRACSEFAQDHNIDDPEHEDELLLQQQKKGGCFD